MAIKSYRDLLVWQRAMQLAEDAFRLSDRFPRRETYGLSAQMRRSAVSVPSNIAEGAGRRSTREYLHFVSVALGSLSELETQLDLAVRLKYLDPSESLQCLGNASELGRMLHGLRQALAKRAGLVH